MYYQVHKARWSTIELIFHMTLQPENRRERFIQYAHLLHERFQNGMLAELQPLNQWVVWRSELIDGKKKKVPYNPRHHSTRASVKVPDSWGTLHEAIKALETGKYSGIGFIITPPLVMVDLDGSYDKATKTITSPQAEEIVHTLNSYTEASPGSGMHILCYGQLPGKGIHRGIEIYGQDRFTTITTNHIHHTPLTITHRQDALVALYKQFAPSETKPDIQNTSGGLGGQPLTELPPEASRDPLLQQLLSGDTAAFHGDHSRADFVLVMKLLHWTGDNIELTRSLFLASPLGKREKAERSTGETTYIDMTIYNVLRKRRNPPQRR